MSVTPELAEYNLSDASLSMCLPTFDLILLTLPSSHLWAGTRLGAFGCSTCHSSCTGSEAKRPSRLLATGSSHVGFRRSIDSVLVSMKCGLCTVGPEYQANNESSSPISPIEGIISQLFYDRHAWHHDKIVHVRDSGKSQDCAHTNQHH